MSAAVLTPAATAPTTAPTTVAVAAAAAVAAPSMAPPAAIGKLDAGDAGDAAPVANEDATTDAGLPGATSAPGLTSAAIVSVSRAAPCAERAADSGAVSEDDDDAPVDDDNDDDAAADEDGDDDNAAAAAAEATATPPVPRPQPPRGGKDIGLLNAWALVAAEKRKTEQEQKRVVKQRRQEQQHMNMFRRHSKQLKTLVTRTNAKVAKFASVLKTARELQIQLAELSASCVSKAEVCASLIEAEANEATESDSE
jgi:hypothetical protein